MAGAWRTDKVTPAESCDVPKVVAPPIAKGSNTETLAQYWLPVASLLTESKVYCGPVAPVIAVPAPPEITERYHW